MEAKEAIAFLKEKGFEAQQIDAWTISCSGYRDFIYTPTTKEALEQWIINPVPSYKQEFLKRYKTDLQKYTDLLDSWGVKYITTEWVGTIVITLQSDKLSSEAKAEIDSNLTAKTWFTAEGKFIQIEIEASYEN